MLTAYLDEIKQYLTNIIKRLKSTGSSWKINFILDLYHHYEKDDKGIEKEMVIWGVYGVIMLETNTRDFTREMFKSAENRYENLNKKM